MEELQAILHLNLFFQTKKRESFSSSKAAIKENVLLKLTTRKMPSPRVFRHLHMGREMDRRMDKLRYTNGKKQNVPNRVARRPFLARRE